MLAWYVREQAWNRSIAEAVSAALGRRLRAHPQGSAHADASPHPWAPIHASPTESSRRVSRRIAQDLMRDASQLRAHLLGADAALSARRAAVVLNGWVPGVSQWRALDATGAAAEALRLVNVPEVRRFLRHYWRRSGQLWGGVALMEALLQGASPEPRMLPPLVAWPRGWDVHPVPSGRVLEEAPHRAFEVIVIDPDAGQVEMLNLWRRMRPRGPGRPRQHDELSRLRALVESTGEATDWPAIAKAFSASTGRKVSADALRMRWRRTRPRSR